MIYIEHIALALFLQTITARLTSSWWAGAGVASAYFLGRELAQAEYRWIEYLGHGLRTNMPWWAPFDRRVWTTLDQWMDWAGPIAATSALALWMHRAR